MQDHLKTVIRNGKKYIRNLDTKKEYPVSDIVTVNMDYVDSEQEEKAPDATQK